MTEPEAWREEKLLFWPFVRKVLWRGFKVITAILMLAALAAALIGNHR